MDAMHNAGRYGHEGGIRSKTGTNTKAIRRSRKWKKTHRVKAEQHLIKWTQQLEERSFQFIQKLSESHCLTFGTGQERVPWPGICPLSWSPYDEVISMSGLVALIADAY